jgi:hypothetical protein
MNSFQIKLLKNRTMKSGENRSEKGFENLSLKTATKRFLLLIGLMLSSILSVESATIIVTTNADTGLGSFRDAVMSAQSNDTIEFDAAINGSTILLTTGEILIDKNLTIDGNGAANTIIDGGSQDFRMFSVASGAIVQISAIMIRNGGSATFQDEAVAIYNEGNLTLIDCEITGHQIGVDDGYGVAPYIIMMP